MQNNTTGAVMPKRIKLMDKACHKIKGFSSLCQDLDKSNAINGKSQSTSDNYRHHLAHIALFYDKNPLELTDQEVTDYLYMLIKEQKYSLTFFRFVVFGMRAACKLRGLPYDQFKLPSIPHKKKLPVVLNSKEMRSMIEAMPFPLKDCLILMLFMDTGLRLSELRNLKVSDIDLERRVIHVHQGKRSKDRVIPFGKGFLKGFIKYYEVVHPTLYVFEGSRTGTSMSAPRVTQIIKTATKRAGILKNVSAHTLRHSYASSLLENGVNLLTIQKLLGHTNIKTTMIYLQVIPPEEGKIISPMDAVFNIG